MKANLLYKLEGTKRMVENNMHPIVIMLELNAILDGLNRLKLEDKMECLDKITEITIELGNRNGCQEEAELLKHISESMKEMMQIESKINNLKNKCKPTCDCKHRNIEEVVVKVTHIEDASLVHIDKEIEMPMIHNILNKIKPNYVKSLVDISRNDALNRIKIELNNSNPLILDLENWSLEVADFKSFSFEFAKFLEIGTVFI